MTRYCLLCLNDLAFFLILLFSLLYLPATLRAQTCSTVSCHKGIISHTLLHSPVEDGECSSCHIQRNQKHPSGKKGQKDFSLSDDIPGLCFQCHEPFAQKSVTHPPVAEGECLECHDPHGSEKEALLSYQDRPSEMCFQCHDEEPFISVPFKHGPASGGYCLVCHTPHTSNQKGLLRDKPRKICLFCHVDFENGISSAPFVHSPIKEESCIACHNPHGSANENLVNDKMPGLCIKCHDSIGDAVRARHKHNPLFTGKRCGNCHDIHFSNNEKLLLEKEAPLCLTCHGKTNNKRSHPLRNIKEEIKGKKYLHGPVEKMECTPCHNPHGSDYWRMLKGPYPEGFYANYQPGIYDFCWKCHDSKILRFSYKKSFSDFSNGNENLHIVHVKRDMKGRSCRSCHAAHGSNWPKLINDQGAPFGEWKIPIRFQKTATGGGCIPGCHREISYDRKNPVEYKGQKVEKVKKRKVLR